MDVELIVTRCSINRSIAHNVLLNVEHIPSY